MYRILHIPTGNYIHYRGDLISDRPYITNLFVTGRQMSPAYGVDCSKQQADVLLYLMEDWLLSRARPLSENSGIWNNSDEDRDDWITNLCEFEIIEV